MNVALGTTTDTVRPRNGLRNVCVVGVSAAVIAAGLGATPASAMPTRQVMHLEATLAASVISTVASVSEPTASNSVAAHRIPTASATPDSDPAQRFIQGLVIAGAATLLTPIWYVGFPVTIPVSAVIPKLFWQATGQQADPTTLIIYGGLTAIIYALLPPALILGGLAVMGSALTPKTDTQPAAAAKTKTAASATQSGETPTSTGHSRRASRTQRSAAATSEPGQHGHQSRASSKKSTTGKRTVGSSGRQH